MTRQRWPYRGDNRTVQARRVALAYRQLALRAAPEATAALDEQMRAMGQSWAIPRPVVADPDAWISVGDAASLAAVSTDAIGAMRRAGRLPGRQVGKRWEYRVGDIMALATQPRQRNGEAS